MSARVQDRGIVAFAPDCVTITYWSMHGEEPMKDAIRRATRLNLSDSPFHNPAGAWYAIALPVNGTVPGDTEEDSH